MDSQAIERIAASWLAKRDGGSWTEADEAAFLAWQRESTLHHVAVLRLRAAWQQSDRLRALGAGIPSGTVPQPGELRASPFIDRHVRASALEPGTAPPRRDRRRLISLVASIALVAIIGTWHFVSTDHEAYRTAIGDQKAVQLSDGSRITLNTDSRIHVDMSDAERRIEIDRGEAYFEVAKDANRPFVVRVANKEVVAVGTKFAVLWTGNELRVIVTEGEVRVRDLVAESARPAVALTSGTMARSDGESVSVTASSLPELEQALSWRSGFIVLRETALSEAVAEFNRYNKRKLVIGDPSIAQVRVSGNLRPTSLDGFARVLEQGFSIQARHDGERIVLLPR